MLNNYYEPTPKKWRQIGDFLLIMIPVCSGVIQGAPNLTSDEKYWWLAGCTLLLTIGKFMTNLFKDDTKQSENAPS